MVIVPLISANAAIGKSTATKAKRFHTFEFIRSS
jgi:hypothetical protein